MSEHFPVAIVNAGTICSGDVRDPVVSGDTIVIRDGKVDAVGTGLDTSGIEHVLDVDGAVLAPGLIDSHVHPVLGDFTPRQRTLDFIDSCVHGGVTSMISAGEVHLPGRPKDAAGTKALAILAAKSFASFRPGGVKVRGGAVLLERGLTEADFAEMAAAGVRLVGEIGITSVYTVAEAEPMVRWAQAHGMKVIVHTGGASVPGSNVIAADTVVGLRPDVAGHVNGGPTALPTSDVERILDETDAAVEIVHCGNVAAVAGVAAAVAERLAEDRLVVGTDMPSGTGVVPLGMLRTLAWLAGTGRVTPEQAIACATGNTARVHGLDAGRIAPGAPADIIVLDAPRGSQASDGLEALRIGDTPSVPVVFVDGEVKVNGSRNTPPPTRAVTVPWLAGGGGH